MTTPCPACGSTDTRELATRAGVVVHQNLPLASAEAARGIPRGDLALRRCPRCGLVANHAFDESLLSYGPAYDNNQIASHFFGAYVDDLVARLVSSGLSGKRVVEVGCGKGYFLERLCRAGGNTGIGYDATYEGPETSTDGRVRFVRDFYRGQSDGAPVDAVVCRHVIEHVARPVDFVRSIRDALATSPRATIHFETPALEWIVDGAVFWDLFYEHASYFTETALSNVFRLAGLRPTHLSRVFRGQYLWIEATRDDAPLPLVADAAPGLDRFADAEAAKRRDWSGAIDRLAARGPVAIWGAGAKGVTFLNLLDPGAERIRAAVDVSPGKQGRFVPGTGHAIVAPEHLGRAGVRSVILMNPNYLDEVATMLRSVDASILLETAE